MQLHGKNIKLFTVDSHIEFRREYTVNRQQELNKLMISITHIASIAMDC